MNSKEKFTAILKKLFDLILILLGLIIAADSLFYTPSKSSYGSSGSSYYGSSKHSVYQDCPDCLGTGTCRPCKGSGYYSNYGVKVECSFCDGNKVCGTCHGSGKR